MEPFGIFCTGTSFLRIAPVKVARQAKLLNFPPRFALGQAGTLLGIWVAHTLWLRPLKGHTNTPTEGGGDYKHFSWLQLFSLLGGSAASPPKSLSGWGRAPLALLCGWLLIRAAGKGGRADPSRLLGGRTGLTTTRGGAPPGPPPKGLPGHSGHLAGRHPLLGAPPAQRWPPPASCWPSPRPSGQGPLFWGRGPKQQ